MSDGQFRFTSENGRAVVEFLAPFDDAIDFNQINLGFVIEVDIIFEKVKNINSKGIKKWIDWISRFSKGTIIRFHRVPKVVIDQINMVADFLPENTVVMSFFVPFFSDKTGEEKLVLLKLEEHYPGARVRLPKTLDSEKNPMSIDVHEGKYFSFLRQMRREV